jgi:hypothetical protein
VVVPNPLLMDGHQSELAQALGAREGTGALVQVGALGAVSDAIRSAARAAADSGAAGQDVSGFAAALDAVFCQ